MRSAYRRVGWLVCGLFVWASPAAADVVTDWNLITTQAVAAATVSRPGPAGLIDIAIVQLAVHDAMQAFQKRFDSYGAPIPSASGSPVAAVARASRDVLIGVGLTTAQGGASVDTLYMNYIAARGLQNDPGLAVGQQAAAQLLALRANNTGALPANAEQFFGGTGAGEWRPTSFSATGQPLPMVAAYIRDIQPFTLRDASQFRQEPPPHLASGKYADEYNEVKALGSLTGSSRRPSQTDMALFFADNAIQYWNRTMRSIALDFSGTAATSRGCSRSSTWRWPTR
jgi:hypothetical protein